MAGMPLNVKIMPKSSKAGPAGSLVVALAYDGLCLFEFGVAAEAFGLSRPEMGKDWYRFAVAAAEPGRLRSGIGRLDVSVDGGLELIEEAGTVIIPGWRSIDAEVPAPLVDAVRNAHARGARILTICSGVFVLAAAGLLTGRRATTHWRYAAALQERFPDVEVVPNVLYIDDGEILTSAGSAAGIDLCLHLIRRDFGTKAANSVARRLVVPPHRDGGQAQYAEAAVPEFHEGNRLGPLLDAMSGDLKITRTVRDLADLAGMSERTFLRRFRTATGTTPARWLSAERLRRAREMLEDDDETIERIADLTGFGSATNFRHHFRKELGVTPTAYRERFRAPSFS